MTDRFSELEEPKSSALRIVVFAFGLIFAISAYHVFTSASKPIQGVVESVEPLRVINVRGASVEDVSVQLPDGSIIRAQVANSQTLQVGDEVRVMEQRPSGDGPHYLVIGGISQK